ncbi:MAG: EAL domain-containing protein [bacterium]|nr:EAL domain-containing protein [bacterium]MCM1376236.1 EAL domain-containing protein [Muribaculum sp.]
MRKKKWVVLWDKLESSGRLVNIRSAFIMAIPVILAGSIALIVQTLLELIGLEMAPLNFIRGLASLVYNATFGVLSLIMTALICIKNLEQIDQRSNTLQGILMSVTGFILLNGGLERALTQGSLGVKGMFTAIVTAYLSSELYGLFQRLFCRKAGNRYGDDPDFQDIVRSLPAMFCTITILGLINQTIALLTPADSFNDLFVLAVNWLAGGMGRSLGSGICFVLISSLLWFFGIHGSDVLEPMTQRLFQPAIESNSALVASGGQATEILSKTFFDVFVLMGGCGCLIGLFFCILITSRNKDLRSLTKLSAPMVICNINEMMTFGIPVIMNPVFLAPFLLAPLVCLLDSWAAMRLGLVPLPIMEVEWITPPLISGYMATGSLAGTLLQLINIGISILIYWPFLKIYEAWQQHQLQEQLRRVTDYMRKMEHAGRPLELTRQRDEIGTISRKLAQELNRSLREGRIRIFYQPQYNAKDECMGAEALLRFGTERYGDIYPPLVLQLAKEMDYLWELEKYILSYVVKDAENVQKAVGHKVKVSINVTPETMQTEEFMDYMELINIRWNKELVDICIEVTEQTYMDIDDMDEVLSQLHELGYMLAIDDFSMGSTSIQYLKKNYFDIIKLDGNLVKNIFGPGNEREILNSITTLAKSLGIQVIAEYTENRQIQKALEEMGCSFYQGYFYSPAVSIEQLGDALKQFERNKE